MTVQWAGGGNGPGHRKSALLHSEGKGFFSARCLGDFCLLACLLRRSAGRLAAALSGLLACLTLNGLTAFFPFVLGGGKKENPQLPQWHSEMTLAECDFARGSKLHLTTTADDG